MSDVNSPSNRKERRALRNEGVLDTAAFLKLADKFIDLANRENKRIPATDLHMAFLYGAARYSAHVAKVVMDVPNHEEFVKKMVDEYREMLRQHLADPSIGAGGDERSGESGSPR
ncbi:MAG: DUF3144 domain-containing protein [Hyphomicrobiaceae bacterium]|nr:DUF3144 domain-containing protein [Hyphomicrobiaceae bacterium]